MEIDKVFQASELILTLSKNSSRLFKDITGDQSGWFWSQCQPVLTAFRSHLAVKVELSQHFFLIMQIGICMQVIWTLAWGGKLLTWRYCCHVFPWMSSEVCHCLFVDVQTTSATHATWIRTDQVLDVPFSSIICWGNIFILLIGQDKIISPHYRVLQWGLSGLCHQHTGTNPEN